MDSHGNICGIEGSQTHTVTDAEGKESKVTNVFEVTADTAGLYTGGKAPENIVSAKYGVFPRLASDVASQLDKFATDPTSLKLTQLCVDECPKAGEVVCSYYFLSRWQKVLTAVKGKKKTHNPVADPTVRKYMRTTSSVTRFAASLVPSLIDNACSEYTVADEHQMCVDTFIYCDYTPAPSNNVLGRCLPSLVTKPTISTQRCIEPLSDIVCDPSDMTTWSATGSDSDFNTECMESPDAAGVFYKARYTPIAVLDKKKNVTNYPLYNKDCVGKDCLDNNGAKNCVRMEQKKLQLTEIIPQMSFLSSLTSVAGTVAQYMGDIRTAWYVVLGAGLVFPLIFSFVYTLVMRCCAGLMVWFAILLFVIFTIAAGIVALLKGGALDVALVDQVTTAAGQSAASSYSSLGASADYGVYYEVIGYCLLVMALITLCMCLFLRKAISDAIHIIEMAAKGLSQNFALTLYPIITFAGIAMTGAVFLVIGVLLLTAGNIKETALQVGANSTGAAGIALAESMRPQSLESFSLLNYMMFFDLFMFLWTTEFIQAIGIMTVGGTISHWYFGAESHDTKPGAESHGQSHPCCCSYWMALRFHAGSAAFGALLIAIVQSIRVMFEYVDHQMKEHEGNSAAIKALRCITKCCLCCLEKCIRFISKNAYIKTSISGDGFCFAAFRSYKLIFNHLLAFGATNSITAILMIVGKIMVCIASMLFGYVWVNYSPAFTDKSSDTYITSSLFISIAVLMMAYLVSEAFFNVFHVTIDTIMLAYCIVSVFLLLLLLLLLLCSCVGRLILLLLCWCPYDSRILTHSLTLSLSLSLSLSSRFVMQQDIDTPPKGQATRGVMDDHVKKLGKQADPNKEVDADPAWANSEDGCIKRCC